MQNAECKMKNTPPKIHSVRGCLLRLGRISRGAISIFIILFTVILATRYPKEISHSVSVGITLCKSVIVPSVFPYMVIADLIVGFVDFRQFRLLSFTFERIFAQKREDLSAFVLGILCGFPLGVIRACELYKSGVISKCEAERLIGFSNNAGLSFVVSGIGLGLLGDIRLGVILYLTCILSAILVGVLFAKRNGENKADERGTRAYEGVKRYSLTESIKRAGLNTVGVCSFIIIFSALCGLVRSLSLPSYLYLTLVSLLEVGSATSIISKAVYLDEPIKLAFLAFATAWSGISVHLQAKSHLNELGISQRLYIVMKLLEGILCAILFPLAVYIFY